MSKKSDSIEKQLAEFRTDDSSEELKKRIKPVFQSFSGPLREFGIQLFDLNDENDDESVDESEHSSQQAKQKQQQLRYLAFDKATVKQRKQVFNALAPEIADYLEDAWQLLKTLPYQSGYQRRAFRAPNNPEASLGSRVEWFQSLANEICGIRRECLTAPWLARWSQHAFNCSSDCVIPLLIAAINRGGNVADETFEILYRSVTREESVGVMAGHVIGTLLGSNRKDGWDIMEKTLIAAQRQEGLRQSILTNVDCAHPDAFLRLLRLILDLDLLRFSSAARSVNIWFGLLWDSASTKVLTENVKSILAFLDSPESIVKTLKGKDPEAIYRALWVSAYNDAPATVKLAEPLLKHADTEVRFVAVWILTQMKLDPAVRLKMQLTDDENLQVALMSAVGTQGISLSEDYDLDLEMDETFDDKQFERLERLFVRLPEKPTKLDPILWPWTERKVDRKVISGQFLQALGNRPPTRMIPYIKNLDYWELRGTIRELAKQKKWDEITRKTLINLTGDLSQDVRESVFEAFENQNLQDDEYQTVEEFLRRKSSDLRNGILKIILRGTDTEVLDSADRLLKCRDANQRSAGLELLRQMAENSRERLRCQTIAEEFVKSQKKLSKDELSQVEAIGKSSDKPVTLSDGLGLLDNSKRTKVQKPVKIQRDRITKAALNCIRSLDQLFHKHRQTIVRVQTWTKGKYEEKPLGECRYYEIPKIQSAKPLEPQLQNFPLSQIWLEWLSSRPARLRDSDGLEILRAWLVVEMLDDWQYDEFRKDLKKADQLKLAEAILGDLEFPKTEYPTIVLEILKMLFYSAIPSGFIDYLLDCNENAIAHVSQEMLNEIVNSESSKKKKKRVWDDDDNANDWRNDFLFEQWPRLLRQILHQTQARLTSEQSGRYWQIQRFFDEPFEGAIRNRLDLETVLNAVQENHATLNDITDCLIGSDDSEDFGFYDLGTLTSNTISRKLQAKIDAIPGLDQLIDQIRSRILEVELNRGETPTAATRPALALKSLLGGETLFRVMSVLNKNKLKLERGWRSDTALSREVTLTHLMKITQPTQADTTESFQKQVELGIQEGYCSEERLLDLAFLAPQWSKLIADYLGWEGFSEGLYWFLAHMNTWFSGATQAAARAEGFESVSHDEDEDADDNEQWDSETESQSESDINEPEKENAWERLIRERTPLTSQEREEGAVDVAWFRRTWELLGENRWKQMAESAKFAANASQARKAQFLTDVLLGIKSRKELIEGIRKKNLKEHVRLLGLLPLDSGKKREADIRERFDVIQDYRQYARKLSSLTKPDALRAAEIGMNNLARLAGYTDPLRLEWALEAESTRDLAEGPIQVTKDEVTVTLELDSELKPRLTVIKSGKSLKAIPAALKKKHPQIAELSDRASELKKKAGRTRRSLEQAMCRGDLILASELVLLMDHALVGPLLKKLVLIGEGIAGYPDKGGKVLRDHSGRMEPIKKNEKLRIAHPYDLLVQKDWSEWQHECYSAERIQPFKQIFRELYVMTAQEKKDASCSRRYSGQQIHPRQAFGLFNSREWSTREAVSKVFHDLSIMALIEFQNDIGTAAEVEGLTIQSVRFVKRDTYQPISISDIPEILFSEVMRDLDLVVSVAHRGEVDPEASASTVEMRSALIRETCLLLGLKNVLLRDNHAYIDGHYGEYSLHLGSGGIHMLPGGSVAILPVHAQHRGRLFLPFADDDPKSAEVLSKVLLLAQDETIQDPSILSQLGNQRISTKKIKVQKKSKDSLTQQSHQNDKNDPTSEIGEPILERNSRRFELSDGKSNKFWVIEIHENQVITSWGRIGTTGQSSTKTFLNPSEARQKFDSLIREKTAKGYQEIV